MLSVDDHDRNVVNLVYVYPVVSRRAGGVSLGINLNPNNKCNWQCVYCQVPGLTRGVGPVIDIALLKQELDGFLNQLLFGDYMDTQVPEQCRKLCDVAISGNGEPTTCPNFQDAVAAVIASMEKYQLKIPLRLISNGSSVHKQDVQSGLELMAKHQGEVWFKVDAVTENATQAINGVSLSSTWQMKQLELCAQVCPTWLQTCVIEEQSTDLQFVVDYLAWLTLVLEQDIQLKGVLLYSLARPSMQKKGQQLKPVDNVWLQGFAQKIESLGLVAKVS